MAIPGFLSYTIFQVIFCGLLYQSQRLFESRNTCQWLLLVDQGANIDCHRVQLKEKRLSGMSKARLVLVKYWKFVKKKNIHAWTWVFLIMYEKYLGVKLVNNYVD